MNEVYLSPKIGLVTVLYNGKEVLPKFFESLSKQTYQNYVLYVIDNSPNDEAINLSKQLSKKYNIPTYFVNNNDNLGVAKGNNQGIELCLKSDCEFVLLLNNDIDFEYNIIKDTIDYAILHNENIVVPKIYYAGTNKIWQAGGGISKVTGVGYHVGENFEDIGQFNQIKYYENSSTCFALIRSIVFEIVGFMDEDYFVYYDDTDFFYRCYCNKINILYLPQVTINHHVSFSTGGNLSSFSIFYGSRNLILFFRKNFNLIFCIFYEFLLLIRILVSFLKHRSYSRLVNGIRGYFNGLFLPLKKGI